MPLAAFHGLTHARALRTFPQGGKTIYTSIKAAIDAANDGERIRILPGEYNEKFVIDKVTTPRLAPLAARSACTSGQGPDSHAVASPLAPQELHMYGDPTTGEDVIIRSNGAQAVISININSAGTAHLHNLKIVHTAATSKTPSDNSCAIDIYGQGKPHITECDIVSIGGTAIQIRDGAGPLIVKNKIHDSRIGVKSTEYGLGEVKENDIFQCSQANARSEKYGETIFKHNRLFDCTGVGIQVDNGGGHFFDNNVYNNTLGAVEVMNVRADINEVPLFERNNFHHHESCTISVHSRGQALFRNNDITECNGIGVKVATRGFPTMENNRIHGCKGCGVMVLNSGHGRFVDNEIHTLSNTMFRYVWY